MIPFYDYDIIGRHSVQTVSGPLTCFSNIHYKILMYNPWNALLITGTLVTILGKVPCPHEVTPPKVVPLIQPEVLS